jgi:hypothetical protein
VRKWLVTIAVGLALALAALTARWWLSRFLKFLTDNNTVIQTLDSFVALAMLAVSGLLLLAGLWQFNKRRAAPASAATPQHGNVTTGDGSFALAGGVNDSKVTTGDDNVIAEQMDIGGDLVKGDKTTNYVYTTPIPRRERAAPTPTTSRRLHRPRCRVG